MAAVRGSNLNVWGNINPGRLADERKRSSNSRNQQETILLHSKEISDISQSATYTIQPESSKQDAN